MSRRGAALTEPWRGRRSRSSATKGRDRRWKWPASFVASAKEYQMAMVAPPFPHPRTPRLRVVRSGVTNCRVPVQSERS